MSEESRPKETSSQTLQRMLNEFAAATPDSQRTQLEDLIKFIKQNATKEAIMPLVNKEFQQNLHTAMASTLQTPLDIDGQEVNPWTNCGTVVVIDLNGNIQGAISIPPTNMEDYGSSFNFYAPALGKAVASMYLRNSGLIGGIADNRRHLKEITNGAFTWHTGATDEPVTLNNSTSVYLGASGCEAVPNVISSVLDGATSTHWTQAGTFDEAFAGITGTYLQDPAKQVQTMNAPRPIERLVAGN